MWSALILFIESTQKRHGTQTAKRTTLSTKWMIGIRNNLTNVSLIKSAEASMTLTAAAKEDQMQQRQQVKMAKTQQRTMAQNW